MRRRLSSGALAVWAVALLAGGVWSHLQFRAAKAEARALLAEHGLAERMPRLAREVEREVDALIMRTMIARGMVGEGVNLQWIAELSPAEAMTAARGLRERLDVARGLARDALEERPTDWQAWLVLGAADYLEWLWDADPRLFTARSEWEDPLILAADLAPQRGDAEIFRCSAYLPLWQSFDDAEREALLPLMRRCFQEPAMLARNLDPWLEIAGSTEEALAVLPERSRVWETLAVLHGRHGEWERAAAAKRRARELLRGEMEESLAEAETLLDGGEPARAGSMLRGLVAEAPSTVEFAPAVERALTMAPSGVPSPRERARSRELLKGYLEICAWEECPLSPPAMRRLADWSGELDARTRALALLAEGRPVQAIELARRIQAPLMTEEWGSYLRFLARLEAEGRAPDLDPATRRLLPGPLEPATRREATDWRWREGVARLTVATDGAGLALDLLRAPDGGSLVQVTVDGRLAGIFPVRPGGRIRLDPPDADDPVLVELETLAGGRVIPGAVRLLDRLESPL